MSAIVLQIFFSLFNFLLVAALLYKFAGPMVVKMLTEKHEANTKAIADAEMAQAQAARELSDYKGKLANVDKEFASIVSQARDMAAQVAKDIEETAKKDGERLRQAATAEIERERAIASQAIQKSLLAQALEAARRELERQMTGDRQRQLVSRFIQKVGDGSCAIRL
jgi:F-type H+-transporting ATPase subunit b